MKTLTVSREELLPLGNLQQIPGWGDLEPEVKKMVEAETREVGNALLGMGKSRLSIGEHLLKIQAELEPRRKFSHFLKVYNMKRSVAYNHINGYKNASALLPAPVLQFVAARNVNMIGIREDRPLGVYTDAVKKLPPPQTKNVQKMAEWLSEVETLRLKHRAKIVDAAPDKDQMLKECYRYVANRLERIDGRGRGKRTFLDKFVGMLLAEIGVSQAQSFEPEAAPEDYKAVVGRPRLVPAA